MFLYDFIPQQIKLKQHQIKKCFLGAKSGFKTKNIVRPKNALFFIF